MKKIRKLWQVKFFKNYLILIISFLLLESIFRVIEGNKILTYSYLRIFIGLNIIALIISLLLNYVPKIVAKIFNPIITLFLGIYGIAQLGFNNYIGVYASLQIKSQASAVTSYFWEFLSSFRWYYYLLLIPFVLVLIYYIFIDKRVDLDMPKRKFTKKLLIFNIFKVLVICLLCFSYYITLKLDFMQNKYSTVSTFKLFRKPSVPSLAINEFGYIGFGILDIKEYILPGKEISFEIEYNPDNIQSGNTEIKEQVNIDNEIWKDIIDKETNSKLNNLNKYFISNEFTTTNEYTGIFKDKNVIVLMIESGSNIMLKEEYYPNIAKLYKNGLSWNNFYSPRNSCATGNNEMSAMTGLYTIYNMCTTNIYKKNTYFESIFSLFNNKGYYTNSFHNHFDAYYGRTTIHKNMGSNDFYKVQDMNIKYSAQYGKWASDEDLMDFYLKKLDERDTSMPFMSWITTVTSHQPYTNSYGYNDEYIELMPEDYPKDVRRYMSKLKVVDNAIGILLDGLEERKLLDDTVIVLFADHYPYGISTNNLNKALDYDTSIDNNADNVPFVIYNSELEKENFEDYTTYVNIVPTVANLFDLDYDSRLYMGEDLLGNNYESLVVFADGSWKNEIAYYNAGTTKIKYYTEKTYSDEEILAINEEISLKLEMSSAAIKNNYFNYLNSKISSYTVSE
ncbi:MAG: hypothetical protein E7163_01595 [Firmicutes bacterium]|nr:hypothetical protein [Bacillota bacterium]